MFPDIQSKHTQNIPKHLMGGIKTSIWMGYQSGTFNNKQSGQGGHQDICVSGQGEM